MWNDFSGLEVRTVRATSVELTEDTLTVDLDDGRTVSVPLAWYPRLSKGTPDERINWRLIGNGEGINWPDLDEDISVRNIVFGRKSDESADSLRKWEARRASTTAT
jgi:hypothetical protein